MAMRSALLTVGYGIGLAVCYGRSEWAVWTLQESALARAPPSPSMLRPPPLPPPRPFQRRRRRCPPSPRSSLQQSCSARLETCLLRS
eukprot:1243433-Rhodomonas_salina.1